MMSKELSKKELEDIEYLRKNMMSDLKVPPNLQGLKETDVVGVKSMNIKKGKDE